jgi:hypothetical protein
VVAAVLSLHAAVLLPIALSPPPAPSVPPQPDILVVPLDLSDSPTRRTGARRTARSPAATPDRPLSPIRPRVIAETAPPPAEVAPLPVPPASPTVETAGPPMGDPWRGRRLGPPASIPCPPAPGDRIGARLCLVGPAPDRDREPEVYADVGEPRRNSSEQAREDGFARQAEANDAWRSYTRDGGAYPGLRSLFRDK